MKDSGRSSAGVWPAASPARATSARGTASAARLANPTRTTPRQVIQAGRRNKPQHTSPPEDRVPREVQGTIRMNPSARRHNQSPAQPVNASRTPNGRIRISRAGWLDGMLPTSLLPRWPSEQPRPLAIFPDSQQQRTEVDPATAIPANRTEATPLPPAAGDRSFMRRAWPRRLPGRGQA